MGIGIFFGILLILAGTALILRILFNIDIPVFKLLIAFILIYIGIRMLSGDFSIKNIHTGQNAVIFGETKFRGIPENHEYTIIFAQARIDLSDVETSDELKSLKINTIFGESELIIRKDQPIRIKADAAFASARLPGNKEASFGKVEYQSRSEKILLEVESNVVFGEFRVLERE
jgi:predicted membrane protein